MGTRNLTMVIQDNETKVAQYGQWDGFPEGQGITVLSFLQEKTNIEKLKEILPKIRFENEQDIKAKTEFSKSIGAKEGWLNLEQAGLYDKEYPLDSRDLGGGILYKLLEQESQPEITLVNAESFASESMFCEWAYVIDLDNNTLEVYRGYNQSRLTSKDRFYSLDNQKHNYRPIKIIQRFSLDKLPDAEKFILKCNKEHSRKISKEKDIEQDL